MTVYAHKVHIYTSNLHTKWVTDDFSSATYNTFNQSLVYTYTYTPNNNKSKLTSFIKRRTNILCNNAVMCTFNTCSCEGYTHTGYDIPHIILYGCTGSVSRAGYLICDDRECAHRHSKRLY